MTDRHFDAVVVAGGGLAAAVTGSVFTYLALWVLLQSTTPLHCWISVGASLVASFWFYKTIEAFRLAVEIERGIRSKRKTK